MILETSLTQGKREHSNLKTKDLYLQTRRCNRMSRQSKLMFEIL